MGEVTGGNKQHKGPEVLESLGVKREPEKSLAKCLSVWRQANRPKGLSLDKDPGKWARPFLSSCPCGFSWGWSGLG